ncbi:Hypothetical protein NTJ_01497 [Nesidiocoris tenuis]|uniref:Uncharacterized protein n=1 Tax=Nesidiocoris tenuis TaxID=355587 RepID=A0ABN7A8Q9_9HEMI|nr:Hypothetical protein NTJ_01497 [Nesidiocoris tenuis]
MMVNGEREREEDPRRRELRGMLEPAAPSDGQYLGHELPALVGRPPFNCRRLSQPRSFTNSAVSVTLAICTLPPLSTWQQAESEVRGPSPLYLLPPTTTPLTCAPSSRMTTELSCPGVKNRHCTLRYLQL